ncbi:MAG: DEAD/DEAH box helicase [Candidatus Micrarchaeota archaeon]|nr:DEAD/DEAH box helicase [Candidatus Micrarchaeota archaeon]
MAKIGFTAATEVQERAIPIVLQGKDIVTRAKTGTGKTAAFTVPIIQRGGFDHRVKALIIVPTRELALQVSVFAEKLGHMLNFRVTTVYGGASINVQIDHLRRGVDIVVGTPGRIIDLMERDELRLENLKYLVLDEADIMLDMGFIEDIEFILSKTPVNKQTMLFSATMPREILSIARRNMREDHATVTVGAEEDVTVNTITHNYFTANGRQKFAALLAYVNQYNPKKCIIFTSTKHASDLVHALLVNQGLNAILLHGGLTQAKRERSLAAFKKGAQFMIATNIASRGLDIADVTDVINFDAPDEPNVYIHRVGRSARMGKNGRAFTLFSSDQRGVMNSIKYRANIEMHEISLNLEPYKDIEIPKPHRRFEDRIEHRHGGGRPRFGGHRGGNFSNSRDRHGGGRFGGGHRGGRGFRGSSQRRGGYAPGQS